MVKTHGNKQSPLKKNLESAIGDITDDVASERSSVFSDRSWASNKTFDSTGLSRKRGVMKLKEDEDQLELMEW
jgi:hypothetical protein